MRGGGDIAHILIEDIASYNSNIHEHSPFANIYLPVIKKCSLGVGMSDAMRPIKSLFIYPGYLKVVVLAAIMVDTSWFI